jgi:hypothetical protein
MVNDGGRWPASETDQVPRGNSRHFAFAETTDIEKP